MKNDNCDGSGPCYPGKVRVLPIGTNPHHGNLILCRACYLREIAVRKDRNTDLAKDCQFALPTWESLKVYGQDEPTKPTRYQHRRGRRLGVA